MKFASLLWNIFVVALAVYLATSQQAAAWLWLLVFTTPALALIVILGVTAFAGGAVVAAAGLALHDEKQAEKRARESRR